MSSTITSLGPVSSARFQASHILHRRCIRIPISAAPLQHWVQSSQVTSALRFYACRCAHAAPLPGGPVRHQVIKISLKTPASRRRLLRLADGQELFEFCNQSTVRWSRAIPPWQVRSNHISGFAARSDPPNHTSRPHQTTKRAASPAGFSYPSSALPRGRTPDWRLRPCRVSPWSSYVGCSRALCCWWSGRGAEVGSRALPDGPAGGYEVQGLGVLPRVTQPAPPPVISDLRS